ncbi:MAG: tRNA (adenosine(37)-N6)-threonylcarbamoyltransferase complex dimerization subunit type 1 TsaB [Rhizobiales bacterium]|nr:tRNA (adenosine(37)-N6)-threonylcarbamoyltransferase complex dimerization subunit type 1 TsaB [Hyphomicrobiales bacterium]OJY06886.1 MAG: tRNA (adenosine(37)-N6)-threonylcarbamoyltransferase complex dimerization subunit type 1 TsaB [Rhizobiales bacterium 63-22]
MKILALDTAASLCAAAVYDGARDAILGAAGADIGKGHAEVLMDYVAQALAEAQLAISDMDRIAVNIGPGSFTGVRIGVSAARGFALALGCPAVGVTAFEAIAAEAASKEPGRPVMVLLDAHRGEIYAQGFDTAGQPQAGPAIFSRPEAETLAGSLSADTVLAGSAAPSVNTALAGRFQTAVTAATADIATYALLAADRSPGEAPKPLYMRGPDAKPQTGFALPRRAAGR